MRVAEPYVYEAVTATFTCGGQTFTAKGRRILSEGWREIDHIFRASLKSSRRRGGTRRSAGLHRGSTF